jgi:hypothetical protein
LKPFIGVTASDATAIHLFFSLKPDKNAAAGRDKLVG